MQYVTWESLVLYRSWADTGGMTTSPQTTSPAPIGAVVRVSVLGKPITDTVTGYAVTTFGADAQWTDVPCYVLGTCGAWPVRDCEVVR